MADVKRYWLDGTDCHGTYQRYGETEDRCDAFLRERPDGKWMEYDDHARIVAEQAAEIERNLSDPTFLGNLIYRGNSVAYIYDKMLAYKASIGRARDDARAAGRDDMRAEIGDLKAEIERLRSRSCGNCKHWKLDASSRNYLPGDRFGTCPELGRQFRIHIDGDAVAEIDEIEETFLCRHWQQRGERNEEGQGDA